MITLKTSAPWRALAAAVTLLLSAPAAVGCATAGGARSDWDCPRFPPALTEFKPVTPDLTLDVHEARERMADLEKHLWFDTPSGHVREEFATWGDKTRVDEVRCLRPKGEGFKSVYNDGGKMFSVPAESFASIGGKTVWRFETPVAIRTGKRVLLSFAIAETIPNDGRDLKVNPNTGRESMYTSVRSREMVTVDLSTILPDDPDGYRYLVDRDEDRWLDDTGIASFIILPAKGSELDPSRNGYVVTARIDYKHMQREGPPYIEVRKIFFTDVG